MQKLLFLSSLLALSSQSNYMKSSLDDMSKFYGNANSTFDDVYFSKLTKCLDSGGDDGFLDSQNMAWKGIH